MTKKETERMEARQKLLDMGIKPGDKIQTILRSVSQSGMNRKISLVWNGTNISWLAAKAMGNNPAEKFGHWCLNCSGCGMDMGFDAVYNLSWSLWPKGTDTPHGTRNGQPDTDGGYALKQEWL